MPWLHGWTLRARLLVVVTAVAVPALGGVISGGLDQRRHAAAEARRNASVQARGAAADEERLVADTRQLLSLLSHLPEIHSNREACSAFLADLLSRGELYANLGVTDAQGQIRCSGLPSSAPVNVSSRRWFRRAVETRDFAVGDYQIGVITRAAGVNFAYPILEGEGPVQGVVFAAVPVSWLQQRLAEAGLPAGSEILIVGPSLRLLARFPEVRGWTGRSLGGTRLGEALRAGGEESIVEVPGLDGVQRLYATVRLQEVPGAQPVRVSVGIPTRVAYAAANRALMRNLLLLAIVMALIVAGTWWSSGVLVLRPVHALLRATRRLSAGDLSARAPQIESRNEVDELARSFNDMAGRLEARAEEVREHLVRIHRLNRVYAVLSGINSLILRIREREELLRAVCRLAVRQGEFALAWIGEIDTESGALRTVARAATGDDQGETPRGAPGEEALPGMSALVETVLRNGREVVSNDLMADPRMASARERLRSLGVRSTAVLPLLVETKVTGVLQLYAGDTDFFNDEELRLLRDLAADTSLGLEYIEKERRLHYLANYDPLTDLPNRALFIDRLKQAIARGKSQGHLTAVLALGIDRFPEISATLGHQGGDQGLQEMARHLLAAVEEGDTVARLGADFGIILTGLSDLREVERAANEILAGAPVTFGFQDEQVLLSFRIGIAVHPHDGTEADALMEGAALALQTARVTGATITFYSTELNAHARERRSLEYELRRAVEHGELTLHYQPVVSVPDRTITGVEALLRWHSPELGDVSPAAFIPIAEETDLILGIGEWILATAVRQGRRWREEGLALRVNVNVSVRQLRHPDFVERAVQILQDPSGEPPPLGLGIEITETELMENVLEAAGAIARFKGMGLMVYIDDFGTGYSSLSYLRTLAVDALKIDQSFVRDVPTDADAVAVVRSVIALAHGLGLHVIAEGVETEEQFSTLRELGCDAVQGYLFSRAVQADEVEVLLRASERGAAGASEGAR